MTEFFLNEIVFDKITMRNVKITEIIDNFGTIPIYIVSSETEPKDRFNWELVRISR